MNRKIIVTIFVVALATSSVYSACTRSENAEGSSEGIVDNIKCKLSDAGDSLNSGYEATKEKVKEGVSVVTSSDTFGKISGWFSKASDSVKSAASKAGDVISDGYSKTVEATKGGYAAVKDTISGKPAAIEPAHDGEGINVRALENPTTLTPQILA